MLWFILGVTCLVFCQTEADFAPSVAGFHAGGSRNLNPSPLTALCRLTDAGDAVVPSRAEEYRRLAQQCLELSQQTASWENRTVLVHMAQVWQRLADEQEEAAQQQVRPKDDKKE